MSRRSVRIRPAARRDLADLAQWFRENVDAETATRFADSATRTFRKLADEPGLGSPIAAKHPDLSGARKWTVEGFRNLRIFYVPLADGIRVVRVLHAAQDWR